ncbi:hypothetical protein J6590_071426, partial [Homalodisca vitripennis]
SVVDTDTEGVRRLDIPGGSAWRGERVPKSAYQAWRKGGEAPLVMREQRRALSGGSPVTD